MLKSASYWQNAVGIGTTSFSLSSFSPDLAAKTLILKKIMLEEMIHNSHFHQSLENIIRNLCSESDRIKVLIVVITLVHLEPCQTPVMKRFCKNS